MPSSDDYKQRLEALQTAVDAARKTAGEIERELWDDPAMSPDEKNQLLDQLSAIRASMEAEEP